VHAVVQEPQWAVVSSAVHALLQHACPAAQHMPLHDVCPEAHVRQSVPDELQVPVEQVVTAGAGHCPAELQT
jgi:hypothetical protein